MAKKRDLEEYERKRDFAATPEPPARKPRATRKRTAPRFVVQEHHARALHWDLRLERDGVLVVLGRPEGDTGRSEAQPSCGANRRPSDGVPHLRGRHPAG